MERNLKDLIAQMTLEEKAGMCSGLDFWHLKGVERLGIPSVMVSDGPHGLRKQDESGDHLGINDSIKAVCFPPAALSACSFDRELMHTFGDAMHRHKTFRSFSDLLSISNDLRFADGILNTIPKIHTLPAKLPPHLSMVYRHTMLERPSSILPQTIRNLTA